ncbi:unnamed protein product [marine sediment metagenome]|uniref:Uncharacterized protein n=1 Tax=marine sediment metagenome TaxID=412755 RepID=X1M542_9ZZZZ
MLEKNWKTLCALQAVNRFVESGDFCQNHVRVRCININETTVMNNDQIVNSHRIAKNIRCNHASFEMCRAYGTDGKLREGRGKFDV